MTETKVLFLAPVEPWGRESGSSLIIADLLEGLSGNAGVKVFGVFARPSPVRDRPAPPAGLVTALLHESLVPRWRSAISAAIRGSTPMRHRFRNREVAVATVLAAERAGFTPDLVHVEHLPLVDAALAVARVFGVPVVFRSHNFEAQLVSRRSIPAGALRRITFDVMAAAEARAARACALTLCVSDQDTALFQRWAPGARAETLPCSLLLERYDPHRATLRSAYPVIGFAGGLDWEPNAVGLKWFVEQVWPEVKRARSDVRLRVLARGADRAAWLCDDPRIEILPSDSDARSLFASSWITIAPLLEGGGVRIKIVESLALGAPVVATTIGAEGHALPGIVRADEPALFAEATLDQLAASAIADSRAALQEAVERRHGARRLASVLVDAWRREIRRARGEPG